ncbi:hypothetical protein JTE90_003966 [Oedothorax gibbosus]|uniref:Uncharacterized protein n=1 Tax=Oedothorax gibbosus TaxID=931172 RepID=A0AAV6UWJ9_9ARAC|nr:hypothetical protein JTE90_003966 [Oedothorax gibbosus]
MRLTLGYSGKSCKGMSGVEHVSAFGVEHEKYIRSNKRLWKRRERERRIFYLLPLHPHPLPLSFDACFSFGPTTHEKSNAERGSGEI